MKKLATYDTIKKLVKYLKTDFLAPKAKQLNKARAISLTGDITGSATFDGTADVNINSQSSIFRQPNTSYQVGDTVYIKGAGVKYYLLCVTAGTTAETDIDMTGVADGSSITDGTVTWTVHELASGSVKLTNLGYQQVTKLNTSAYKGVDIPIKANADFVRPPISVLKLRDDGITETDTVCEFNNGDASDFVANDGVVFTGGIMKPRTVFEITMTEPTELASGYISNTELIDMTNYKAVKAVDVR